MARTPKRKVSTRRRIGPRKKSPVVPRSVARFLNPGKQTQITKTVRKYASSFPGTGLGAVRKIIGDLTSFERRHFWRRDLAGVYAKRSAEQIISDRFVAVPKGNRESLGQYAAVAGCVDYNVALCAVLRAKGIPAKFTREKLHSTTLFFLNGKWYEADPANSLTRQLAEALIRRGRKIDLSKIPGLITEIPGSRQRLMNYEKQFGQFAEGLDAWDIGIRSLRNFAKYNPPLR